MKKRIRELFPHHGAIIPDEGVPRGWINPHGTFLKTKEHWVSITSHFRNPDERFDSQADAAKMAQEADRTVQLAYSLGWISVGHAGKLNAVGHQRTFSASHHPAVATLRKLLADSPEHTIQIETQIGEFLPSKGTHEEFELREYDLEILIKRGKLREPRR